MNEGLCNWVMQNNQPTLVTDTITDKRWLELPPLGPLPRSALAVPIQGKEGIQAVLVLSHSRPNHFTDDHLKTLLVARDQIATALTNVRQFDEAQSKLIETNAILESSLDGYVFLDLDGRISFINTNILKLLNLSGNPAAWVNQPVIKLLQEARHANPKLVRVMIGEVRRHLKGSYSAASGEVKTHSHNINWASSAVITDRRIGCLIVFHNITEQRKKEKNRDELTDMIIHDIRNPASAIFGIINMLKSPDELDQMPEDYNYMLQLAERNVTKISELVDELLDVSQLESGRLPVHKTPIQLDQLIEETIQLQRPLISMKEVNMETQISPDLPSVMADVRLIRRVLQNLVDNAAKFSHRSSTITISARISADDPDCVQVSVQDNGVGIPTELQSWVFEKFVTEFNAQRGSGIGLTFCRLAITAHNGRIWAESEENLGSTFHFILPIH
ncbi:MAG: ATP-binding protein, partial [Candidatus Promineifilaceae bacterium]